MLKLRGDAGHLASLVTDVHEKFSTTGGDLVAVINELNIIQSERENARKLLEYTIQCKKISSLMVNTKEQIESDDHYNAMRTIEEIQNEMKILHVKSLYVCLEKWLPIAINKLLYGARSEADNFIAESRQYIELIGNTILCRQAQINITLTAPSNSAEAQNNSYFRRNLTNNNTDNNANTPTSSTIRSNNRNNQNRSIRKPNLTTTNTSTTPVFSTSLLHIINHSNIFNLTTWAKSTEFENTIPLHFILPLNPEGEELVDIKLCALAPLHKVLHLYAILSDLNSYHEHYRILRNDYITNILKNSEKMANEKGLEVVLPRLFDQIIGFFTIECVYRRCVEVAEGCFSYQELSYIWDDCCIIITKLCSELSITIKNPDILIKIKEDILVLIDVITDEAYGFNPKALFDVLKEMWEIFRGIQIANVVNSCIDALDMCAYQPYTATTMSQYLTQIQAFHLDSINITEDDNIHRNNRRRQTIQLKERETKREKSILTGKAAANLDALEEELSLSIHSTSHSPKGNNTNSSRKSIHVLTPEVYNYNDNNNTSSSNRMNTAFTSPLLDNKRTGRTSIGGGVGIVGMNPLANTSPRASGSSNMNTPITTLTTTPNINNNNNTTTTSGIYTPHTYPFSFAVPLLLRELHILIIRFFLFAVKNTDLGGRSEDICLAIVSVYDAICKSLKKELNKDGIETPLSKACQIAIDGASLLSATDTLWIIVENSLKHFHWTENLDIYLTNGIEKTTFSLRNLILSSQDLIFELLTNKIDALLESLTFINFLPEIIPTSPHECIESIIEFLKITLLSLDYLPISVKDAVYFTCCSRISQGILNYILSNSIKNINMLCILNFEYDIKLLINFANNTGVQHLKQCFEELYEIIKCLLHPNLIHYSDNLNLRNEHFPYIQTSKLVIILEKVSVLSFILLLFYYYYLYYYI